jgi:hypothetical protein
MKGLIADVQHQGDRCSIYLKGYLSSESSSSLEEAFVKAADYDKILLVFAEKTFVNSVGLAVLFDLIFPLQDKGKLPVPSLRRREYASNSVYIGSLAAKIPCFVHPTGPA